MSGGGGNTALGLTERVEGECGKLANDHIPVLIFSFTARVSFHGTRQTAFDILESNWVHLFEQNKTITGTAQFLEHVMSWHCLSFILYMLNFKQFTNLALF